MTSKEKAESLVRRMQKTHPNSASEITLLSAKESALIVADELEKQEASLLGYDSNHYSSEYWYEVKQEIKNFA